MNGADNPTFRKTPHDDRRGDPHHWSFHGPPNILDVLDHWEAAEHDAQPAPGYVWVCPGCYAWQVECRMWIWHNFDGPDLHSAPFVAANDLVHDHRAVCPALDMLAGFEGILPA